MKETRERGKEQMEDSKGCFQKNTFLADMSTKGGRGGGSGKKKENLHFCSYVRWGLGPGGGLKALGPSANKDDVRPCRVWVWGKIASPSTRTDYGDAGASPGGNNNLFISSGPLPWQMITYCMYFLVWGNYSRLIYCGKLYPTYNNMLYFIYKRLY